MNGLNVVSVAASSAARRPTVRMPTACTSGIDAIPAITAGSRTSSGARPARVVNQESMKLSGGEISAVVDTVWTTSDSPWADTTQ